MNDDYGFKPVDMFFLVFGFGFLAMIILVPIIRLLGS